MKKLLKRFQTFMCLSCAAVQLQAAPEKVIVLDPGHGGTKNLPGSGANHAIGPNGLKEKDIALEIADRTKVQLENRGYKVLLTRISDDNLTPTARTAVARTNQASVFVSIHFNGANDPLIQGTETWVHSISSDDSKLLAASLLQRLVQATELANRGTKHTKEVSVLEAKRHYAGTAVCLVEVSFLSHSEEANRLKNESYKKTLASHLAVAIDDYIKRSSSITPVSPVPGTPPELWTD